MAVGFIVTIVALAALLGIFAKQALATAEERPLQETQLSEDLPDEAPETHAM